MKQITSALGAGLVLFVSASGAAAQQDGFPVVSCPAGVTVTPSGAAVRAQRSLLIGRPGEALTMARGVVTAQPGNPQHQFLLGRAAAANSDFAAADSAFNRTVALCPNFAREVEPERARAWLAAFQQGLDAYQASDTAAAISRWEVANAIYQGRPDAWYNLGVVHSQRGNAAAASAAYRKVLDVVQQMPADSSAEENASRMEARQNAASGLLMTGAQLFQREQFQEAGELFQYLTGLEPRSRDAWYNYSLVLFKRTQWRELVPAAERVISLDPLNENARIILFNAFKGLADARGADSTANRTRALGVLEQLEALPLFVDEIRLSMNGEARVLSGRATGNAATAGQQVTLTFSFWGPQGEVGSRAVTVAAPAKGQSTSFQLPIPEGPVSTYSYTYR
jgi:tetratricopeptide (TPR) repeat protein